MASTVYSIVEVELLDGSTLTLKPLKIKLLREFMKRFQEMGVAAENNEEDDSIDLLVDCTQIAMKQFKPELAENRDALEEVLDLQTMYKIIEIASGIKLNDPNLIAASLEQAGMI